MKYVNIYYDKANKTQRFVIVGEDDCKAKVDKVLKDLKVSFTNSQLVGRYTPLSDFKNKTYKYATKWQWLNTIDLTKGVN